jgi:hypothetical protein
MKVIGVVECFIVFYFFVHIVRGQGKFDLKINLLTVIPGILGSIPIDNVHNRTEILSMVFGTTNYEYPSSIFTNKNYQTTVNAWRNWNIVEHTW